MASYQVESIKLGEGFELDVRAYELRRSGRVLKLERIPMDLLLLLVEQRGQLVSREQIIERIWGKDVYLDADNSINAAIRKIRQALHDDPDHPRFIQTITGKGYRFIAPIVESTVPPARPEAAAPENLIGKKVSHYRVLQVLGGGGMGVVYKAEDLELGRSVAIKFLPGELASDPAAFARVQKEARAASSLDHPNICSIYELGEHEGRPFIVMQLLQGQTLREWIEQAADRDSPACLDQVLNLSVQICAGMEAAHEQGVIHRDIKPANIFVTARGEAKILDFGVAKFMAESADADSVTATPGAGQNQSVTETGVSSGTPAYLSPEQVRREKLDPRTDLFSFGLMLYEMATGRQAFLGNTAALIREAVLHQPVVPPCQLQPAIPAELERILLKALAKDRNLRYQSAAQLRTDLENLAAIVKQPPLPVVGPAQPQIRHRNWQKILLPAGLFLVVVLIAGGLIYRVRMANRLTEKDTVVIADFANSTGDPIFDDTLKQGLSAALHQSPFLTIISDDKIGATLKLMTRPVNAALTPEVAREVCQRAGSKVYIAGAIAALGNEYVLGLKAVNCQTGDVLASQQVTVAAKEKVVAGLGGAAAKLRSQLGESLATVQKYDVPLEQATTPSLEALKAYSLAYAEANRGSYRAAIQFYERAIALDPDFAVAYAHMGQAYANSGQDSPAVESIKKAFDRRSHASELEKLYIETRYHELVTQEVDKRIEALELWEKMYPRDPIPYNDLASEYSDMGKYDQALAEAQQALEFAPQHVTVHILLGVSYMGLDKIAEARSVREKQVALNLADTWDHADLYGLAYLQNDSAAMQREVDWCKGKPDEYILLRAMAARAASAGKLREARELYRQAIESAKRAGSAGAARTIAVNMSLMETLAGNPAPMGREELIANAAGAEGPTIAAAHIFALTGDTGRAAGIVEELARRSPTATYVNKVWVPTLRAEIEISRNNPARALELLQSASPYELGWKAQYWPTFVRGLAYLGSGSGSGRTAAAEFQKVLDHRGVTLSGQLSPLIYSLSQLELARAQALSGDAASARSSYEKFFTLWKDADPDVPVLLQAKAEYARLQ